MILKRHNKNHQGQPVLLHNCIKRKRTWNKYNLDKQLLWVYKSDPVWINQNELQDSPTRRFLILALKLRKTVKLLLHTFKNKSIKEVCLKKTHLQVHLKKKLTANKVVKEFSYYCSGRSKNTKILLKQW